MKNGHFVFLSLSFGGLEASYTVHVRLVGKHVVDFLCLLIELFLLGIMAEVVRANTDWKIAVSEAGGSISTKFSHRRGRLPPNIFACIDRPVNVEQLCC